MRIWTGRLEATTSDRDNATVDVAPGSVAGRRVRLTTDGGDETVSRNLLLKFLATARQSA